MPELEAMFANIKLNLGAQVSRNKVRDLMPSVHFGRDHIFRLIVVTGRSAFVRCYSDRCLRGDELQPRQGNEHPLFNAVMLRRFL